MFSAFPGRSAVLHFAVYFQMNSAPAATPSRCTAHGFVAARIFGDLTD
jgi:hypothetical protein